MISLYSTVTIWAAEENSEEEVWLN